MSIGKDEKSLARIWSTMSSGAESLPSAFLIEISHALAAETATKLPGSAILSRACGASSSSASHHKSAWV